MVGFDGELGGEWAHKNQDVLVAPRVFAVWDELFQLFGFQLFGSRQAGLGVLYLAVSSFPSTLILLRVRSSPSRMKGASAFASGLRFTFSKDRTYTTALVT
jgi:hypothetical protein